MYCIIHFSLFSALANVDQVKETATSKVNETTIESNISKTMNKELDKTVLDIDVTTEIEIQDDSEDCIIINMKNLEKQTKS